MALNSSAAVESAYADADDLAYDIVLEEHQTVYESATSDDVVLEVAIARHHDDFSTGETIGALDTNADGDSLLVTAANLEGRADITAHWYERYGRVTDTVRYGTNGGSNLDRDGLSVPARSDTALLTETTYATDGTAQDVTDPKALVFRTLYDDAGRTLATIRNYVNGTPSSTTGDDDGTRASSTSTACAPSSGSTSTATTSRTPPTRSRPTLTARPRAPRPATRRSRAGIS